MKRKDLKKISKYQCGEEIKEAYIKYLTNYSFKEFVNYCEDNDGNMEDLIFAFTDLQLERFEPNSIVWISHVMVNFMIYFNVNLDYGQYYDAYASALQLTVFSCAMKMAFEHIGFDEVEIPEHCSECFEKLFKKAPDFRFNLENDCNLAYKSFNTKFDFTSDEFCMLVNAHFDECGY